MPLLLPAGGLPVRPSARLPVLSARLPVPRRARFLLLLALRQLLQALQRFVQLALPLTLFAPLHRLVLILELVGLQLEQIRQIFGLGVRLLPAATLLLSLAHLDFAKRFFGTLQMRQRPLFPDNQAFLLPEGHSHATH